MLCERVEWLFGVFLLALFVPFLHRRGMARAYATGTLNARQLGRGLGVREREREKAG